MGNVTINRFEWMKAVMQADGLTATAKNVAAVIAVQFANDETGKANPSQATLSEYLKVHKDTVKRVLRELRNAGWLLVSGSGGRSVSPTMRLVAPTKIIPFRCLKRGGKSSLQQTEKGDELCAKEGQIVPPHYKDKQSLEQKRQRKPVCPNVSIRKVYETESAVLSDWNEWTRKEGLGTVQSMPVRSSDASGIFFELPWKYPPSDPDRQSLARQYLIYRMQTAEVRHAAE